MKRIAQQQHIPDQPNKDCVTGELKHIGSIECPWPNMCCMTSIDHATRREPDRKDHAGMQAVHWSLD